MSPPRSPSQLTLGIIKPSVCSSQAHVKQVLQIIKESGLEIVRQKRLFWKAHEAEHFYSEHAGRFYFPRLVQHATSSPFIALALYGPSAITHWRTLIGPTHVYRGQWLAPDSLRARFGMSDTRNGFHGSDGIESATKELGQVFEGWDLEWWIEQRREQEQQVIARGK